MSALTLRADESANDLFKRLFHSDNLIFNFQLDRGGSKTRQFAFGDLVDFKCHHLEVHEVTLSLARQFADQFPDGLIVHISSSNNFFSSLKTFENDLCPNLRAMLESGAVRSLSVFHVVELVSAIEMMRASLVQVKVLLVFESLGTVLRSAKVRK